MWGPSDKGLDLQASEVLKGKDLTFMFRNSASILGSSRSKVAFGGIIPFSRTMVVLIRPAKLVPPSRWPVFDFRAPLKIL